MIRLGLRLAGRGGHGALARLALMVGAIGVGVALVLVLVGGTVGSLRRSERTNDRNVPSQQGGYSAADEGLLWAPQELQAPRTPTVTNIAVAALGADPPVPPGTSGIPAPGTVLVSPELRRRIEAGTMKPLPGRVVGTLGPELLGRPDDLVMMTGWELAALRAADPQAQMVASFPERDDFTNTGVLLENGDWPSALIGLPFVLLGISILLLPVLVLVGAGARVGARRREQRLAALRLAGATPHEMRVLTAVEGAVAGLAGSAVGVVAVVALRQVAIEQDAFFFADLTLPLLWVGLVVVMGPLLAAASAALAMGRVATKPLGPAREVPEPVGRRRWSVLAVAWVVFLIGIVATGNDGLDGAIAAWIVAIGFLGIVVGLIVAGPRLVQSVAGGWARHARRPAVLLAGRRLQAQPRLGFRAVLAVLLSLFVTTLLLVFLPSVDAKNTDARNTEPSAGSTTLRPDLEVSTDTTVGITSIGDVVLPVTGPSVALAHEVAALPGVQRVLPVVVAQVPFEGTEFGPTAVPATTEAGSSAPSAPPAPSEAFSITASVIVASCRDFAALTRTSAAECRPGPMIAPAYTTPAQGVTSATFPIVGGLGVDVAVPTLAPLEALGSVSFFLAALAPPSFLPPEVLESGALEGMYIATDGSAEAGRRVAALLLARAPGFDLTPGGGSSSSASPPDTGLLPLLAYVFVLAACALGVVTVDGIFERRRSLAALRAAGAGPAVLRRATMLEVAGPLLAVAALGTANGIAVGIAFAAMSDAPVRPGWFGLALAAGLVIGLWLAVTAVALPAVSRASSLRELRTP